MKNIKKIIIFCVFLLVGIFIYYKGGISSTTNDIYKAFNDLLVKANSNVFDINGLGDLISDEDINSLEDSGISGNNLSIDATYYPYYDMLNSEEKAIYRQIYANVNDLESTFRPVTNISSDELKRSIEAVFYDHPELFWLNNDYSYKYTKDGKCVQIIMNFNDTITSIDSAKNSFNNAAARIIYEANKYSSNYEKEKYVHDYIINTTSYNTGASLNQSAYSALVNKQSVCAGYARAFQYIMIKLGIPTYYVVGSANEAHAWNIVGLDDGYYNVDVTWDDQGNNTYSYFNRTDNYFSSSHTRHDLSLNLPSCTAVKYSYNNNRVDNTIKKVIRKNVITKTSDDTNNNTDQNNSIINNSNQNNNQSSNSLDNNIINNEQDVDYIDNTNETDYDNTSDIIEENYLEEKENND